MRLRDAALECFVVGGFDGATMEGIAAAAGLTKKTVYARFPDKRSLFDAVVLDALSRMPWTGEPIELPVDDLESSLKQFARTVVARLIEPRAVALRRLATIQAQSFPEFAAAAPHLGTYTDGLQVLVGLLDHHVRSGTVDVDDLDATAELFLAMVAGGATILADLGLQLPPAERERRIDSAVTLFLDGVRPRP